MSPDFAVLEVQVGTTRPVIQALSWKHRASEPHEDKATTPQGHVGDVVGEGITSYQVGFTKCKLVLPVSGYVERGFLPNQRVMFGSQLSLGWVWPGLGLVQVGVRCISLSMTLPLYLPMTVASTTPLLQWEFPWSLGTNL